MLREGKFSSLYSSLISWKFASESKWREKLKHYRFKRGEVGFREIESEESRRGQKKLEKISIVQIITR